MSVEIFGQPSSQVLSSLPDPDRRIGYACGTVALLVSGLLFRTYGNVVPPVLEEVTRQLDLPYVLLELGVFLWARHRGYAPGQLFARLPGVARGALALFLVTYWISSAFVSHLPGFSVALSLTWIVHLLFGGAVYHLVGRYGAEPRRVAEGFAAGLAVFTCLLAYHFLTPPAGTVVLCGPDGWGSAVPGFLSHRLFGSWCAVVAALLAGVLWRRECGGSDPVWLVPTLLLTATLLIWTGTRAAVVGFAVALLAAVAVDRRPRNRGFWPTLLLVVAVAVPVALALNPHGDPTFMLWRPAGTMTTADGASSGRLFFWQHSLEVARHYPLLGSGAGSSWWLVPLNGRYYLQPHNALVQFLLNWGLVPTLPALLLIGWIVAAAHRTCQAHRERLPFLMALDALLAMSMLDGMFHYAQFVMLVALFCALCLAPGPRPVGVAAATR